MAEMLSPAELGGWGRGAGEDGGLGNIKFSSRCPPTIWPSTRIIAVCGANDYKGASSPLHDGWFHSDFYLFHHLFSGLGANQVWLTCVNPADLVAKYNEFVHGNPLGARRVVLDKNMLPSIEQQQNIRTVAANILLDRFLSTVEDECKIATWNDQHVLILIFGHGEGGNFGVAIGGQTTTIAAPRLTIPHMKSAIGHAKHVAMIMTSCYSGGWVMKRSGDGSKAALNATVMTAAGHLNVSESWAKSESSGRAAGSIYASTILQSAIQMQIADKEGVESQEEIESSTSYIGWAKFICDVGEKDVDRLFHNHNISFAAQNDLWGSEWKDTSSLPPADYKSKWEMLRTVPVDTANPLVNRDPTNVQFGMASLSIGQSGSTSSGQGFLGNFSNIVAEQARQYLNSFPGNDASGCNPQHSYFRLLAKGEIPDQGDIFDQEHLENLSTELRYRMSLMEVATRYKDFLGLPIEDCHLFDTWNWVAWFNGTQNEWRIYEEIHAEVRKSYIFGRPVGNQGLFYTKPSEYLAIGFVKSGWSKGQVLAGIEKLTAFKKVVVSYIEERVLQDPEVQRQNNRFFRTFSRLGQRLRSLSPRKNKEKTPRKETANRSGEQSSGNMF